MRTTIEISRELLEDLMNLSGAKRKKEAMLLAIEDFVRRKKVERLLSLPGNIEIEDVSTELEQREIDELQGID